MTSSNKRSDQKPGFPASQLMKCPMAAALIMVALFITPSTSAWEATLNDAVQNWARLLKEEIMRAADLMRHRTAQDSYRSVKMVNIDGNALLHQRARLVKDLLDRRKEAVERIRHRAEALSDVKLPIGMDYPQPYDAVKNIEVVDPLKTPTFSPPVSSQPIQFWTDTSPQFPGSINTSVSAVHVPSDVYDGSMPPNLTEPIIQHGIWLSKKIEPVFLENYRRDNTTSWQYFAHIKGFTRIFPAVMWKQNESDLYDARFRPWFSSAATSSKNIVILLDNSGSMKGKNQLIARQIIHNILDTLNSDDFVNIILFGRSYVNSTIKCLEDQLVPATLLNVVELKRSLLEIEPSCPSDLEFGLKYAFNLLEKTKANGTGALCNQAIMIVTDGPYIDTSIFRKHNKPFGPANKPVRIFSYQVGEDPIGESPGLKWMACQNQGWYLNVTFEEAVRDRVATYIPVMARPLTMHREHPIHWTHLYSDLMDQATVDHGWIQYERDVQKKRMVSYKKHRRTLTIPEEPRQPVPKKSKARHLQENLARETMRSDENVMMITVSTPVYNTSINVTSPYGQLLGVAGVDLPVEHIQQLVPPHKAGVNGYFFMVNNNGFVLFHPDLRPKFVGILKSTYSSVDMSELEIDYLSTAGNTSGIENLREEVVNQKNGSLVKMVDQPFDDMCRVETVKRRYYFTGLKDTPYSLVLAVHENNGPKDNTFRSDRGHGQRLTEFLKGQWRTHPEWWYCRDPSTKEYLQDRNLVDYINQEFWDRPSECDKELIHSFIEDASLTAWFPHQEQHSPVNNRRNQRSQREEKRDGTRLIEPALAFIATKSGLTRWVDFKPWKSIHDWERHFSTLHPRGPDEVWYRRAALHPEMTIVSAGPIFPTFPDDVNLEAEWQFIHEDDMIITVSKAVLVENHKSHRTIPAVVGVQFPQSKLQAAFSNLTGSQWVSY